MRLSSKATVKPAAAHVWYCMSVLKPKFKNPWKCIVIVSSQVGWLTFVFQKLCVM